MLIREPDGNVVLRSGTTAIRFYQQWGGAPLEWWQEPCPCLTNSFPGSGVSTNWEVGQDPTQATCDGLTPNPIATLTGLAPERNYYIRETLCDGASNYIVTGFLPDFWLSHEAIDDYRVKGNWQSLKPATGLRFTGGYFFPEGLFYPGNEMEPGKAREYRDGRFAGHVKIQMGGVNATALAGIVFRSSSLTAPSYRFVVSREGYWYLYRGSSAAAGGRLTATEKQGLLSPQGLKLEVRTHNAFPGHCELWIAGRMVHTGEEVLPQGPYCGLFARCRRGSIYFYERCFYEVGYEMVSDYEVIGERLYESRITIAQAAGAEQTIGKFYRANTPGMFLNPGALPERYCEPAGLFNLSWNKEVWVGNKAKTVGILATVKEVKVDGVNMFGKGAHCYTAASASNNEFVMMFNPLPYAKITEARSIDMRIQWRIGGK